VRIAEDGEILGRGRNVMKGYYRRPEATAAVLEDGWFHTGDIGVLDADGYLTITDRKKDLIVTSGGKKIAPQPIEARLRVNPLVNEVVLIGDRRKFISVLIVPDFRLVQERLRAAGRTSGSHEELVERADVKALFQPTIDEVNASLAQFERIKKFALLPAEFKVETGELTPTMKVKRKVVEQRWQATIEDLYTGGVEG
jgi:long-chain acyl-CoA synthetase